MPRVDGERVKALREGRLLERGELAKLAGCGYTTIYKIEAKGHTPRLYTVREIAKVLNVSPQEIIERESSPLAS